MRKYKEFIYEAGGEQMVWLDTGREGGVGFYTKKYGANNSISQLNISIRDYINSNYDKFGYRYPENGGLHINKDLDIDGKIINSEYINKMVNNYTVFKCVIRNNNIKNESDFYKFMLNNLNDIYGYKGIFFIRETLPILIRTTRKGNLNEITSLRKFTEYAKSKNLIINIETPTIEEDINGIDGKFKLDRLYTIQVKPFIDYKIIGDQIVIRSNGSLSISTDYLILYDNRNQIILKNPKINPIKIKGDTFISPKSNILKI